MNETRRAVLDCAARLFRTQGYAATSLRHIAAAAGMKAGSLYYHFASKEEIVVEVLNLGVQAVHDEVAGSVAALPEDAPAEAVFETAVAAHLRSLLGLQDYTSANTRIFGQAPESVREAAMPTRQAYDAYWATLLSRLAPALRPEVDLKLLRLFLIGAMNGSLEWRDPQGDRSVDEIARSLSGLMLRGALRE